MLRLPAKQLAGSGNIDRIVIVGDVNHPRPDEGLLAKHIRLDPGSRLGEWLRYLPCLPLAAAEQSPDLRLQLAVTHDLGLAEEER